MSERKRLAIEHNKSILSEMLNVSSPLNKLGVVCFGLVRMFNNGKWLVTSNHQPFITNFIDKIQYSHNFLDVTRRELSQRSKYVMYGHSQSDLKVESYKEMHAYNLWQGLNIYDIQKEYIEYCYFLSRPDSNQMANFYLNNKNILEDFIVFFKQKAKDFMNLSRKDILVPVCRSIEIGSQFFTENQSVKKFLEEIKLKKYSLGIEGNKVIISARELECVLPFVKGNTMKEIGKTLKVSPRTVEYHINRVKAKVGVSHKRELKKILEKSF